MKKKPGHITAKCFFKKDHDTKAVNVTKNPKGKEITYYKCKQKGHISTKCPGNEKKNANDKKVGELYVFGKTSSKVVNLDIDLAIKGKLKLLVDTGADVSLIKAITLQGINSNNIRSFGTVKCCVE